MPEKSRFKISTARSTGSSASTTAEVFNRNRIAEKKTVLMAASTMAKMLIAMSNSISVKAARRIAAVRVEVAFFIARDPPAGW